MAIDREPVMYSVRKGSRISVASAQVVGPELEAIAREEGGISAAAVVDRAATPGTALANWDDQTHYFEWNDEEAAYLHRQEQARNLIRSIIVRVSTPTGEAKSRAFYQVENADHERRYRPVQEVLDNSDWSEQVINRFRGELIRLEEQYRAYLSIEAFNRQYGSIFAEIKALPEDGSTLRRRHGFRATPVLAGAKT